MLLLLTELYNESSPGTLLLLQQRSVPLCQIKFLFEKGSHEFLLFSQQVFE